MGSPPLSCTEWRVPLLFIFSQDRLVAAGAIRFAYNGVEDLRELMPDLTDEELARTDFGTYTENKFFDDMARVTENRADPDLVELLVRRSRQTMIWLRSKHRASIGSGLAFCPIRPRDQPTDAGY